MYRDAIEKLEKWKNRKNRKPLIVRGARQVGKTWLMREFGRKNYEKCAYISMDENERMENVFRDAFDIDRILLALEIEAGFKITPEDTLIIFDEVQAFPVRGTELFNLAVKFLTAFCNTTFVLC